MKKLFDIKNDCRLCKSKNILKVVSIGDSPISEKYSSEKNSIPKDVLVPLDLYMCKDCGHVQIIHVVNPDFLWDNFTFKTSRNPKLINHYENYVKNILNFTIKMPKNFVLDIGSNDGTLLKIFKKNNFNEILGIDPAKEIAAEATSNGIKTIPDYMNKSNADLIKNKYGKANIITANNVYAHIDYMDELTDSIISLLDKEGIFVFEVSYLLDVIEKKLLGTVFHEHLSYHSLLPLIKFFEKKNMEIVEVIKNDLQGGSIVCYVQHKEGPYKITDNVKDLINIENEKKLDSPESLFKFSKELNFFKDEITNLINTISRDNEIIAGFGSARSATTLIKFFDIAEKIQFIVDDNKDKHYKFTPGSRIQVFPSEYIYENEPKYLIIFAWEHADKIIKKHEEFLKKGGSFIKIFPKIEIIKN